MTQNMSKQSFAEEQINISGESSKTYHALPVQGGLVVIGDNLLNVIRDINKMYEDSPNTQLALNPNNISEAMEVLRSKGFFIYEKDYGVFLKGWGTNGDPYAHDGYPKNPGIIQDLHPEPIIRVFHRYSFKEPVGVMVIDENRREYVYMANQPGELKRFRDFGFEGLADAKGFTRTGGDTVWTLQRTSSGENFTDRYPAKIRPGRRFEEVLEFCKEIRQGARNGSAVGLTDSFCESFTTEEVKLLKEVAAAVAHLRS